MQIDQKKNPRLNLLFLFIFASLAALIIAACGGGGGGASSSGSSVLSGAFIDAPVEGLEYQTATQNGTTGPNGEFNYKSGEAVTFKIGKLVLGSAVGASKLTPVHLVPGAANEADPASNATVVNIVRILLSLNANPTTTALKIDPSVLTKAKDLSDSMNIAFNDPNFNSTATALVKSLDSTKDLVSSAAAINHFGQTWQQLTGSAPSTGTVAGIYPLSNSSAEDPWLDPLVVDSTGSINFLIHPSSYHAGKLDSSNGFTVASPAYSASANGSDSITGSIDGAFKITGTKTTIGSDNVKHDQPFAGQKLDFSSHKILGTWYGDFSYTSYSERIICTLTFHADGSLTGTYAVGGSPLDSEQRNNYWPSDAYRYWPDVHGYFYQSPSFNDIAGWIAGKRDSINGPIDYTPFNLDTSLISQNNTLIFCTEYTCGILTKQ